ncbi:COP9 signalosome complex subunit 5 [Xylariomycetidae sp. FL0641]|nr:COP9 signalosome complex subunit 5 [Xylariomycetidae sp. FL0641]
MEAAMKSWELDNDIKLVDPTRDALYNYSSQRQQAEYDAKPWKADPHHFKHVRISAVALIKMVMHARSGGEIEVMGLMQGYTDGDTIVVTDAFGLPVEGTETRVNAQDDANEYMVQYLQLSRDQGSRLENAVGWYHSHPGYGCWLSGIDVGTEAMQQQFNDPFCAVVIDPDRTISAGRVDIGAFRTYPEGYEPTAAATNSTDKSATGPTGVPLNKAEDFGAHASKYYPLEVSHFKSTLDTKLLELLWNKYWVQTLSQSPLLTNRDYGAKQVRDLASKLREAAQHVQRQGRGGAGGGAPATAAVPGGPMVVIPAAASGARAVDAEVDRLALASRAIAMREMQGLMAGEVKAQVFNGLGAAAAPAAP